MGVSVGASSSVERGRRDHVDRRAGGRPAVHRPVGVGGDERAVVGGGRPLVAAAGRELALAGAVGRHPPHVPTAAEHDRVGVRGGRDQQEGEQDGEAAQRARTYRVRLSAARSISSTTASSGIAVASMIRW